MFTMIKGVEEILLQHFIQKKQDIAYAINKPFPFFEALQDHYFITNKMYKDSLDACQDMVPVSRVVLNVLTSLEQTFNPSLLLILFSQDNLSEYSSLGAIFRSFEKVCKGGDRNPLKCEVRAGSSGKCIQNEAGDWLTPKEFLMEGKRSKSKDWKRDIQCKQTTLRLLEQNGLL